MSKTIEITLDEHCTDALEKAMSSGNYTDHNSVIHEAIALFEKKQAEDLLRAEIQRGIDSGFEENWNFEEWLASKNKAHLA